jgi:hypothetical protein
MADFGFLAVVEQDFHDIKPDGDLGLANMPEVIESGAGEALLSPGVHRGGRPGALLGRAGLHLDEHEAPAVAKDQIDFAAGRTIVGGEKF